MVAVLIVAAGRGVRAGSGLPKQYRDLNGLPVLSHTLRALSAALTGAEAMVQIVIHPDDHDLYAQAVDSAGPLPWVLCPTVQGGATRQASVRAGLEALAALPHPPAQVLIHDAARPFVSPDLVARALAALQSHTAAIPGLPLTDTIKQVDLQGLVVATPPRASLRAVQTPQAFHLMPLLAAHRAAAEAGYGDFSDDAAVAEWAGLPVLIFEGDPANMKLTTESDFAQATKAQTNPPPAPLSTTWTAATYAALPDVRTGQGFDVHAFGPGDHVWLGGHKIPHSHGLIGHSDADVLMHAITDAIFGALSDGDIGSHFPPSDPQWKGAASAIFLRYAMDRVAQCGGRIAHVDGTIICEAPKIGPHRDSIRAALGEIMGLPLDRVAIKATTSEQLGFTGRREGMAALGAVTLRLPA